MAEGDEFGELLLFTSGSSGQPKAVRKRLQQLDAEVSVLEQTFAAHLPHCSVIATVSHQHIYGLLFKILWPLAASRPFLSDLVEYPETLSYYTALFPNLCLISSPAQLSRLPDALEHERQLHTPSLIFSSGGPLSLEAAQGVKRCYGSLPIEVYGSTETGGIGYRRQQSSDTPWQAFAPMELSNDSDGALLLRSPYLEDDGQYRCEDKVRLLGEGQFCLEGRLDRIVKIEEKRLSLVQMETLLNAHPWVTQSHLVLLENPRVQLGAAVELSTAGKAQLEAEGKLSINNALKAHLLSQFERVTLPSAGAIHSSCRSTPRASCSKTIFSSCLIMIKSVLPPILQQRHQDNEASWRLSIPAELPMFAGHFPGQPVLPGVTQLDWAVRLGSQAFGYDAEVAVLEVLKFQQLLLPNMQVTLSISNNPAKGKLSFSYSDGEQKFGSGRIAFKTEAKQ